MTKEQAIKSLKKYIIFQESTLNDYYKMDEEFYKDQIEQLELSTTLLKTVLSILEEQDKIIDLMAEKLAEYEFEEMCAEAEHYHIGCPREDDLDGYMKCIRNYFENKAKEYLKVRGN